MSGELPLTGVRVLAIEQYGAGPWGSLQLADLGADVIKIEDPASGGDIGRYVPPYQEGESSLFFETFNRGKRSVSLNLRTADGRAVLHDLVAGVDAVYSNLRGDQPEKLGITFEQLRGFNPRIVCCSLSGYGRSGPMAGEAAYDYVVQGRAGWMSLTGEPGDPPMKTGLSLVDFSSGYVAALALLGGLWRARRDGVGCDCDISLFETALALLTYVGTWAASRGHETQRVADSAHPSMVPFQNFRTADGWIVIACPKEHFWSALVAAMEREDLAEDPRFASIALRHANRDELVPLLGECLAERSTADWLAVLTAAGVPCSPVNDVGTALRDPQAEARGAVVSIDHPELGDVRVVGSALRVGTQRPPVQRAPLRGEHTREVLSSLCGYDADRLSRLEAAGAFGPVRSIEVSS